MDRHGEEKRQEEAALELRRVVKAALVRARIPMRPDPNATDLVVEDAANEAPLIVRFLGDKVALFYERHDPWSERPRSVEGSVYAIKYDPALNAWIGDREESSVLPVRGERERPRSAVTEVAQTIAHSTSSVRSSVTSPQPPCRNAH